LLAPPIWEANIDETPLGTNTLERLRTEDFGINFSQLLCGRNGKQM